MNSFDVFVTKGFTVVTVINRKLWNRKSTFKLKR